MPNDSKDVLSLIEIFTKLLNDAPPAAWFALIGTLTGSALTLVGVYLTNCSSIQRLIIQLEHEHNLKEKENLRLRHEELYIESRKYLNVIGGYFLPYRMVMKGELTFNQALDISIKQSSDHQPHRVTMLIDLYFPELKKEFIEVMAIRDRLNELVNGYKEQYKTGNHDGRKWLELFQPDLELFCKKASKFEDSIAALSHDV